MDHISAANLLGMVEIMPMDASTVVEEGIRTVDFNSILSLTTAGLM
jgi:hypothetical protein